MNISEIITALEELAKHAKLMVKGEPRTVDAFLEDNSKKRGSAAE